MLLHDMVLLVHSKREGTYTNLEACSFPDAKINTVVFGSQICMITAAKRPIT